MLLDSFNSETPEIKATFEQLKSKAPAFLRLVLWPQRQEKKLKLVNKFFDSPLHIQQDAVVCSDSCSDKELLICSATLDPLKMQTSLSFLSGNLSLDALTPNGSAKVILSANRWRITPVDQHHVKISTDDGITFFFNFFICETERFDKYFRQVFDGRWQLAAGHKQSSCLLEKGKQH